MAVERLNLVVLGIMTSVLVAGWDRLGIPIALVAWFVFLFGAAAVLPLAAARWPKVAGIRLVLPIVVLLSVYESLGRVIAGLGAPLRDGWVIAAERWVTGGRLPPLAPWMLPSYVADALSAAYVAYFGVPIALVWALRRNGRLPEAHAATLTLLLAFYLHYAIYVLMPVVGPLRAAGLPPEVRLHLLAEGGRFTHAVRAIVSALEGTPQDAFPSAHTSVACLSAAFAIKYQLRWRLAFCAIAGAIVASTTLLGYHYCVDVAAALPIAWLAWHARSFMSRVADLASWLPAGRPEPTTTGSS